MTPESIDEILTKLTRQIESAGARILRLADYPDAAIEGLRDQILQTGAGRTKPDGGRQVTDRRRRQYVVEAGRTRSRGRPRVRRSRHGGPGREAALLWWRGALCHQDAVSCHAGESKLETPNDAATASLRAAVIAQLANLAGTFPLVSNARSAFDLEHVGQIRQVRATITSLDVVGFREILAVASPGFGTAVVDGVVSITLEYVLGEGVDAQVFFDSKDGVKTVVEVFATQPERAGAWELLIVDLTIDAE